VLTDRAIKKSSNLHPGAARFYCSVARRTAFRQFRDICSLEIYRSAAKSHDEQDAAQKCGPEPAASLWAPYPPQWPLDVDIYLLRAAAAALLLRGARLLFRPRAVVRRGFVKRELLDSENISHAMPAAIRSEAIGLLLAFFIRIGRMSSPRPRVFRPSSRSLTTVFGET